MRTYKFKLYPTKTQQERLFDSLGACRFVYNKLLETRMKLDDEADIQLSKVDMSKCLTYFKQQDDFKFLNDYYSKMLQPVIDRLWNNIRGLRVTKSKGRKTGSLRFKGKYRFSSFVYNQSGFKVIPQEKRYNLLQLSKIGQIRFRQHRDIEGNIKQIQVKKKPSGWYAYIVTDGKYECKNINADEIGIDMGVLKFLTTSKGDVVDNPLYLKKRLDKLKKIYRKFSKTQKGSKNRRKMIHLLLKSFEKIDNQKLDFFHKVTTHLVKNNKLLCLEDLNIKSMTKKNNKNKRFNMRNILDSSWGIFVKMLQEKVSSTTSEIVFVNPKNTSKTCSHCGNIQEMPLRKRQYKCKNCNFEIDRDYNSAINIFKIGKVLPIAESSVRSSMKQEAPSFMAV